MSTFKTLSRRLRVPINRRDAMRRLAEFHSKPRPLEEKVEWAMNFGGAGLFRINTLQVPSEITALARAVAALEPKVILEIGTARGGTLLIWSSLASEMVVSCDLQDMRHQRAVYESFAPPDSACRVRVLSGDSHAPEFRARVLDTLGGRAVDFLFIDGDHSEAGVEADYRDYSPLVRPGGLIAFHDIQQRQVEPTTKVHPFWTRLKQEVDTEEFIGDAAQVGYGIGVVRVPA